MDTGYTSLQKVYEKEIATELSRFPFPEPGIFTEAGIASLPVPVQNYLRYCGYMGKSKIGNACIEWKDVFFKRERGIRWMKINCRQFNSVAEPTRMVYMGTRLLGLFPFEGRDKCQDGQGNMLIRLMKLFTLADVKGKEMDASALVTVLAEALLVPGYVLQDYITWTAIDRYTARATLQFKGTTVSGVFYFNEQGEFIRFETNDRYYSTKGKDFKKMKWTVKAGHYQEKDGIRFPASFRVTWNSTEGDFTYFKGKIASIQFNISNSYKKGTGTVVYHRAT